MPGGDVALRDGEKAREPRFRGQQVVAIGIEARRKRDSRSRAIAARGSKRKSNSIAIASRRKASSRTIRRRATTVTPHPTRPHPRRCAAIAARLASRPGRADRDPCRRCARARSPARCRRALCLAGELRQFSEGRSATSAPASVRQCRERIFELARRHGLRSPPSAKVGGMLGGQREHVGDSARSAAAAAPGDCRHSRHALASAIRCPARLPLSTEETYLGSSTARSRVPYQL